MTARHYPMLLAEIAALLSGHGRLRSAVELHDEGDEYVINVRVPKRPVDGDELRRLAQTTNLKHALDVMIDIATMRSLADRYDIPAEQMEKFLKFMPTFEE